MFFQKSELFEKNLYESSNSDENDSYILDLLHMWNQLFVMLFLNRRNKMEFTSKIT